MGIITFLLVGLIAGWIAGVITKGTGFGIVGDIVVGIIGAFIGSWLFGLLKLPVSYGFFGEIVVSAIGAVVLLLVIHFIRRI